MCQRTGVRGRWVSFLGSDGLWSVIRAWLSITNEEWSFGSVALWVVVGDVDLLLGVECVLKSRAVEEFVSHGDGGRKGRRRAPLGPDTPLFGTRIPPGTSTQSPNSSTSPSTLFDIFDGPLDAARPSARFAPSHTNVAGLSRLGIEPRGMPSTTATGPKWPYVSLHLRVRHDVYRWTWSYHFWSPPRGDFRQEFAAFGFPKTSPVVTRSQAREAASRSAAENLDSSSRTHSTPSPTIPGNFDRDEEDEIDQELQDDFDEEPIPSTAEERTSSPELLGLTTSDYDISTPDLFERSSSSPELEDPIPATSNLVLPTPSSFRAHVQPPIASSSRLSVIPTPELAPPPPLVPSNAASNSNSAPPAPTIPSTTTTSSSSPAPTTTTNMSQTTNTPLMPPRGHSTAPSFDPSEVRSLRRYFQDLEALFTRCQITDEAAKKQWAVRYPSIDVADLWETIESFIDVAKSYNDWKADVRALYPGADDTRKSGLLLP
ncbi:predicted protein [Postia placenta Mad-698-R]|nr:predicted protein [Postia placenta Mad-698-R]